MHLESEIGNLLRDRGLTLATAESCTGGLVGHRITSVAGCSDYFLGGVIAYSNEVKVRQLGLAPDLLIRYGAVSPEAAAAMADGVRAFLRADIGLSVTGIAGPDGGTPGKPVGLVFMGLAAGGPAQVRRFMFRGERETIKESASQGMLEMLKEYLSSTNRSAPADSD